MSENTKYKLSGSESLVLLAGALIHTLLDAWVTVKIWGWFVVPMGIRALTLVQAFGVGLIVVHLVPYCAKEKTSWEDWTDSLGHAFGGALSVLAIGWVVHWVSR